MIILFLFGLAACGNSLYPIAEETTEVCLDHRVFQEGAQELTPHCLLGIRAQGCRSSSLHFNTACGDLLADSHLASIGCGVLYW